MGVLLLLGKEAIEEGMNAQGGKDTRGKASAVDFLRSCAAGKLVVGGSVAAKRREGAGCIRIRANFAGSDGSVRAGSQVISEQNQAVRIVERERAQQDAFDERKDSGGSADAESPDEHNGQGEHRCF